jgi:drug/metabolite transporter (DMT)-like permease
VSPDLPVAILLALTAIVCLACGVHVVVRSSAADRLHVTAPASVLAPALFAIAVALSDGLAQTSGKAAFAALMLGISSPLFGQTIARVLARRGDL